MAGEGPPKLLRRGWKRIVRKARSLARGSSWPDRGDIPQLSSQHLARAKLFADREDLIAGLQLPSRPRIAEVGVALGEFSKFLIAELRPAEFHAFDLFQLHQVKRLWGRPAAEIFGEKTHADYYADAVRDSSIVIHEGPSAETLKSLPDAHLDLAYIDAGHDYDSVLQDAQQCVRAVRPSGILVFNDYVLHDPFAGVDYGVVPVVNDLVVNEGWRVVGFALQKHLFCDIAITRRL